MPYITSTAANDNVYAIYDSAIKSGPMPMKWSKLIKGRHGVANSTRSKGLFTPQGMQTEVTQEELTLLETIAEFKNHVKEGFLRITKLKSAPEKLVKDMNDEDGSRPLVRGDKRLNGMEVGKNEAI